MSTDNQSMSAEVKLPDCKRHRPQHLDLDATKNAELANRIVLPGIPPQAMNDNMTNTIKLSQKIQRQQREIIESLKRGVPLSTLANPPEEDLPERSSSSSIAARSPEQEGGNNPESTPGPNAATTPTTKRLKRENVPTPLNIGLINDQGPQLLIRLAPIRTMRVPSHMNPLHALGLRWRGPVAPPMRKVYKPFPNTQVLFQAYPNYGYPQLYYLVPQWTPYPSHTAVRRRINHNPSTPGGTRSDKVTDVYHGDFTRIAPLLLQPLLAQREAFEFRVRQQRIDEDRLPVLEDEVREMQQKYAQDECKANEIFGLINLMNESVFNFKIFRKGETSETTSGNAEEGPTGELEVDWLSREKEKFMKICETLWDTFVQGK